MAVTPDSNPAVLGHPADGPAVELVGSGTAANTLPIDQEKQPTAAHIVVGAAPLGEDETEERVSDSYIVGLYPIPQV